MLPTWIWVIGLVFVGHQFAIRRRRVIGWICYLTALYLLFPSSSGRVLSWWYRFSQTSPGFQIVAVLVIMIAAVILLGPRVQRFRSRDRD